MNKAEYIKTLSSMLNRLPEDERKEILYDYEEHFRFGIENGKSEEEISKSLGDPKAIARQYKAHNSVKAAQENTTPGNILRAVFAIGVLGIFNLFFILGPFIACVAVLFSFYATGFALTISGIITAAAVTIAPFSNYVNIGINYFSAMCISVFITSFGLLFFIGTHMLTKLFFKVTVKYLDWNLKFVKN